MGGGVFMTQGTSVYGGPSGLTPAQVNDPTFTVGLAAHFGSQLNPVSGFYEAVWVSDGAPARFVVTPNNTNCAPGTHNSPDNKPADIGQINLLWNISNVRVLYAIPRISFVDLDAAGNFLGSPTVVVNLSALQSAQGYFDSSGNANVTWQDTSQPVGSRGRRSTRVAGVFGAPVVFDETAHDTFEAQVFQGFSASLKSDPSSVFYALKKVSTTATDPNYVFRTQGVPGDSTINLTTISMPPDPAKAVNFSDHGLALFVLGAVIAAILVTNDGLGNPYVWMLRSPNAGTTWECRPVARNWNKSYVRAVDFY
jgi:hypothetical protein